MREPGLRGRAADTLVSTPYKQSAATEIPQRPFSSPNPLRQTPCPPFPEANLSAPYLPDPFTASLVLACFCFLSAARCLSFPGKCELPEQMDQQCPYSASPRTALRGPSPLTQRAAGGWGRGGGVSSSTGGAAHFLPSIREHGHRKPTRESPSPHAPPGRRAQLLEDPSLPMHGSRSPFPSSGPGIPCSSDL